MCQRVGWGGEECVRGWEGEVRNVSEGGGVEVRNVSEGGVGGEECVRGWSGG